MGHIKPCFLLEKWKIDKNSLFYLVLKSYSLDMTEHIYVDIDVDIHVDIDILNKLKIINFIKSSHYFYK